MQKVFEEASTTLEGALRVVAASPATHGRSSLSFARGGPVTGGTQVPVAESSLLANILP